MANQKLTEKYSWKELCDIYSEKLGMSKNLQFKKWFMSREKVGVLFDAQTVKLCYRIYKDMRNDMDAFLVFSGRERMGKSTLMTQILSWIDPSFGVERYSFSGKKTMELVEKAKPFTAVGVDEASLILLSYEGSSAMSRNLVKMATIMGIRNICIGLCIPNFHILNSYIRDHRVNYLFEVTSRGKFTVYFGYAIKKISFEGRRYKLVKEIKVPSQYCWLGFFNKEFPKTIPKEEYDELKKLSVDTFLKGQDMEADDFSKKWIAVVRVARELGIRPQSITRNAKRDGLTLRMFANKWMMPMEQYKNYVSQFKST